jgi:hypothetical protein
MFIMVITVVYAIWRVACSTMLVTRQVIVYPPLGAHHMLGISFEGHRYPEAS